MIGFVSNRFLLETLNEYNFSKASPSGVPRSTKGSASFSSSSTGGASLGGSPTQSRWLRSLFESRSDELESIVVNYSFEYHDDAGSKMFPAKAVRSVFVQPLGVRDVLILHFTQYLAFAADTCSQRLTNADLNSSDLRRLVTVYSSSCQTPWY